VREESLLLALLDEGIEDLLEFLLPSSFSEDHQGGIVRNRRLELLIR
jgi:hypothetical protein